VKRVQIRRVARLGTGHTPSRSVEAYWNPAECTIPWLTLADVWQLRDGSVSVVHATKEKISPLGLANSAAVRHPAGTVAFSRTASVGFSCILGVDMATSQDFVTWTCGPKLDPRYLLWVLRAERDDILRRTQGSTHKTIYMPDIEQLTIPLPPVDEQRRIVEYLDRETARIDEIVTKRLRLTHLLDERASAAVATGLASPAFDVRWDGVPTRIGTFPMVRLGQVAEVRSGLTLDAARRFTSPTTQVPYLRVANVHADRIDTDDVKDVEVDAVLLRRHLLEAGDVIMTEGGDIDKLGRGAVWDGRISPCLHQNHVFAVRPRRELLHPYFLAMLTRTPYARAYFETTATKTTGIASTSSSKIKEFRIPLPPRAEQDRLVAAIDERLRVIRLAQESAQMQLRLIAEHRRSLLVDAIAGEREAA
jgi:type I restriction enzyme S subunit